MSNKGRLPIVALILVAANIAAAFAVAFDPDLVAQLGFRAGQPTLAAALASPFLHENLFHLLGNMLFLSAVGPAVELAAGSVRFAVVFAAGALAGVGAHLLLAPPASAPMIGASGAVAACVGYYSVRYVSLRVPLAPRMSVPMLGMVGVWLALQVVGGFLHLGSQGGGTAYWTHLGGFAAGLALGLAFRAPSLAKIELGHAVLREMNRRSPAALAVAARRHIKDHPGDLAAMRELAEALGHLGEPSEEADAWLELLEFQPESDQGPVLARLDRLRALPRLPSLRRTMLAERLKASDAETARLLLVSVVRGPADDLQRPDAMLALAALEREAAPERAEVLLRELIEAYPMHPAAELARARGWLS